MKKFAGIKNISRFTVHSNTESGTTRRNLSGIFCTLTIILITVSTPVWSVNAPTALRVECNGKAEPFFFSAKRTNLTVMHSTEKDCSNGITTPHKTRTPPRNEGKLLTEVKQLQQQLEMTRAISDEETRLKNSCFLFLIAKGLYNEYHEWLRKRTTREVIESIKKSLL